MNVALLTGWFPWTVQLAAAAALLAAIGRRDRRWQLRGAPLALAAAAVLTAVLGLLAVTVGGITDPLPRALWCWLGAAVAALAVLVVGWRGARWWRRALAPLAALLAVVAGANALNASTGYFPTLDDAIGELSGNSLPQQVTLDQLASLTGRTSTGRIVQVDIPDSASGFSHRQELVYLPPAWFRSKTRPKLPVLEMIGGEFAAPDNWVRAGNAVQTADAYAAQHGGFAPVLVFADATGGFKVDTECVNGPNGKAEDHLVKDIPPYVEKTFGAAADPHKWGVVGWSMGGTCAVDLTVEHPDVFSHFEDISGDLGPNAGDKQQTIDKLYGGDAAAWAAHDPLTVLAHHAKYKNASGWFESGDQEAAHIAQAKQLDAAARKAGFKSKVVVEPGKHVWQFASGAFAEALPWLSQQLGTPGPHPGAPTRAPASPNSPPPGR
ncbi:alpha/beta hydrolase-fold protein [Kitasatospora paracochleata]|uniref:Enterochelin esterase-like enzyme n=1 Tax=Kitasatospora paracochleata TaxID=58354 RepID=A0ABT1J208_9ACTN|nr:alpha/beta hydrolase-fold protein [Kitasatospora paracochleata]MCP2311466.1 enterochelin esterase-like enzyme [Kitasatospora paracochleata]